MDLRTAIDRATKAELLETMHQIVHRLTVLDAASAATPEDDVLLTTKQIAPIIAMTPASIDTYVSAGKLIEGTHYFRKGRRRLFSKRAMWAWATNAETTDNIKDAAVIPFPNARRRQS